MYTYINISLYIDKNKKTQEITSLISTVSRNAFDTVCQCAGRILGEINQTLTLFPPPLSV